MTEAVLGKFISWIAGIILCGMGVAFFTQGVAFILYSLGVIKP